MELDKIDTDDTAKFPDSSKFSSQASIRPQSVPI